MIRLLYLCLALFLTVACAPTGPVRVTDAEIAALAAELRSLSPRVSPTEAQRAAALTFATAERLAVEYQITDSPLIHNAKVNAGLRPRGLCYHWADDLQAALDAAGFQTLGTERAIANAENPVLIDHSTTVIVARGAPMESGVIVDPWRFGGRVFWSRVPEDDRYDWIERETILRALGRVRYSARAQGELTPVPVE